MKKQILEMTAVLSILLVIPLLILLFYESPTPQIRTSIIQDKQIILTPVGIPMPGRGMVATYIYTYVFIMENGDTINVSKETYYSHEIGEPYTYQMWEE